jgi:hypothetical protein
MKSPATIAKFRASLRNRSDAMWRVATRRIVNRTAALRGVAPAMVLQHLDPAVFDRNQTTPASRRKAILAACRDALNR